VRRQRSRYDEAIEYVTGLVRAEPTPQAVREQLGLEPMLGLLDRLGRPHEALPCVHISGSKGKGSTSLLCEGMLEAAHVRTGTFTSPHLLRWTERVRIGGRAVHPDTFADAVLQVRAAALRAPHLPSFFDVLTAAALVLFRASGVQMAILETGLGGRLDATNVVEHPRATCITTIELEHTDRLGTTHAAIAREKAGILKRGAPLVLGRLRPDARAAVLERAQTLGVAVWSLAEQPDPMPGTVGTSAGWRLSLALTPHGAGVDRVQLDVGHPSAIIADAAALALACALQARVVESELVLAAARPLLTRCRVPGRLDVLGHQPLRVVDGAHTNESIAHLRKLLEDLGARELRLVVSATRGKDAGRLLGGLAAGAARVYATCAEPSRSLSADELAGTLAAAAPQASLCVVEDPRAAIRAALAETPATGALCVTGSLYLAGIGLEVLEAP
jgi:dihydrofolate synthase/folylpolyglutamate synthase